MWIFLAIASAILLGFYDVAKKKALSCNSVLFILMVSSALTTLFLFPFLTSGDLDKHLMIIFKAALVTLSWVSGLAAFKYLPLTTASTMKASRPLFVVIFSVIIFNEHLNVLQWLGAASVMIAILLLSFASRKEGISFTRNRGVLYMLLSIIAGVLSALYDKYIMMSMEPLFVQSWCNLYITILLLLAWSFNNWMQGEDAIPPRWDWTLILIAVLITFADFLYFKALKSNDAMLSVISMTRRCSVAFSYLGGLLFLKEKFSWSKTISLVVMLFGLFLLMFGTI